MILQTKTQQKKRKKKKKNLQKKKKKKFIDRLNLAKTHENESWSVARRRSRHRWTPKLTDGDERGRVRIRVN
jgi:hypothetical protein